jgi:type IV pilus assembly protein PilX
MNQSLSRTAQRGAALVVAMMMLVILTLLGIAAIRGSKLELRLSANAVGRMSALEEAQSLADAVAANPGNLLVMPGTGYFQCYIASGSHAPAYTTKLPFGSCANQTVTTGSISQTYTYAGAVALPTSANLQNYTYAYTVRNAPEFLPSTAVRSASASGRSYDFTSFTVIAGYDHTGYGSTAAQMGFGAAEVSQGVYQLNNRMQGVNYQ